MASSKDQKLFDEILANGLDMLRLSASKRSEVLRRLQRMEKALTEKLSAELITGTSRARVERFIKEASKIIEETYATIPELMELEDVAEAASEATVRALEIALGAEAASLINEADSAYYKSVNSKVLIQGAPSADWWRGQSSNIKFKFAAELRKGMLAGETNQQIISRIVGKNGAAGVMDVARRDAASLVQTSVQTVANDARRNTFDENDDIIKGLRQVSTLDAHTTIVCVSYSGKAWDMNRKPIEGNTLPFNGGCPRHWGCRSLEIPITKTFREMGLDIDEPKGTTRASSDGQININTSFEDFLKRKGKAYQEDVLGVGRAELWRQKKITLRDLVNGEGRPLTLEQLRAKVARRG